VSTKVREPRDDSAEAPPDACAIVGMSGRFPGAASVADFWRNVCQGVDSISHFQADELEDSFPSELRASEDFVRARGLLADVDKFDPSFFGISPRDAALTDPQHRVFLECAWEALEDAGYDHSTYRGSIGVYAGCSLSTYFLRHVLHDRKTVERFTSEYQVGMYPELLGALTDTLATRVAYKLNLKGPAATVHTACSTSLFAVAQACQSLALFQCDMAIAGGVSITFPQRRGYVHYQGGMVSRDGRCRPFDADASGTVFGSGAGAVLLKRLEDALADGDHIYAIVRGAGVNNDGSDKAGFTAPSAEGQASAIITAHALAGVDPATIGYVESHGTATPLGDPIEFAGLVAAFSAGGAERLDAPPTNYCALGSVKGNVGHLDAAAGVVALIKAALCVEHATIPPLVHFNRPNPRIQLEGSPFYVPTGCSAWPVSDAFPRRAGVSSFGVGGTNVHLVLEQAPLRTRATAEHAGSSLHILPLSAKTPSALAAQRTALARHLAAHPDLALDDVAYTLQLGRRVFEHRSTCSARTLEEAIRKLQSPSEVRALRGSPDGIVFMFPGQGEQFAGMGQGLYDALPQFREEIDHAAELLQPVLEADLRDALFAREPAALQGTLFAQPALFVVSHALAKLWQRLGVRPDAMVGHSVGEFVAAALSGALRYEDALRFVAQRARLMQDIPGGAMLAVRLSEESLRAQLGEGLDLAAVNAPNLCVAAGSFEAIEALELSLGVDVQHRRLRTSHAFHSAMMDGAVAALTEAARALRCAAPLIPYVSSVSGRFMTEDALRDPGYFAQHCRATVRFADALRAACAGRRPLVIEVGPGRTLSAMAAQILATEDHVGISHSLIQGEHDALECMREAASRLWVGSVPIAWQALQREARRVPLPSYPFERVSCWVEAPPGSAALSGAIATQPEPPMSQSHAESSAMTTPVTPSSRLSRLQAQVASILQAVSGSELAPEDLATNFLELGFDSLSLGQVSTRVQQQFKRKISFRQLMSDYPSCAALASHLDATLEREPQPALTETTRVAAPVSTHEPSGAPLADAALGAIFQAQLRAMQELIAQQNQLLATAQSGAAPQAANPQPAQAVLAPPVAEAAPTSARYRQFDPKTASQPRAITATQRAFIDDLCRRYTRKTRSSQTSTGQHRAKLADPRAASGFRLEWKELCYPIVSARSKGSTLWDLDGNAYVDLVNGYGQTLFGHAPDFVQAAVAAQLADGFAIGPQTPLAGEVASLICEFVGMERATFCNTGSEAVMAAMRVARCVTGRDKIAVFTNDYHGQFDEVLVRGKTRGTVPSALPLAPGIPAESVANMLVLSYGSDESLAYLRAHMDELAAVIVEPVQSRHPELRPYEFLRALRVATEASGTALVFDEVVTGFRVHPAGMQAVTGIRADMATYGKVVGGGMPVGILAGSARFMDALDGGDWRFGDDSFPEVAPTFFAGTFVRHPLVLAACKAVLTHLQAAGPGLQEQLSRRTAGLVERINAELTRKGVPSQLQTFSSWFMPNFGSADPLGALFYHQARLLGLHIQDGFPCFLTTAHSDADLEFIARVFSESIDALQAVGILLPEGGRLAAPLTAASDVPLTEMQREVWMSAQLGDEASCAFNESLSLRLAGATDIELLCAALNDVVLRHDSLRASFGATGERMHISARLTVEVPTFDLSSESDPERALKAKIDADARTPFDLAGGPLVRAFAARLATDSVAFVITAHHIVCDGWSMNIVVDELSQYYTARRANTRAELSPAMSYAGYALELAARGEAQPEVEAFWLEQFKTIPTRPELPLDRPRPARRSWNGATYSGRVDAALYLAVKKEGARQGCTLFATLFASFQVLTARLANHDDVVVAVPVAGQSLLENQGLVGHCVNFLPVRAPLDPQARFADHLQVVKRRLLAAFDRQEYTFGTLVQKLAIPRDMNRLPLTELQFNLERIGSDLSFDGAKATLAPNPKAFSNFDLFFNVIESDDGLRIDCDFNADIFDEATIARWVEHFRTLLREFVIDANRPAAEMPLLSSAERKWLLDDLNATQVEYPSDVQLHELIAAQAVKTPTRIAAECAGARLTFGELDAQANRLARHLRRIVGPANARVGVALDRSLDMLVALLAVMKAGHTYVPLDPDHPAARQRVVLETAQVAGLICNTAEAARVAPQGVVTIRLDEAASAISVEDSGPLIRVQDAQVGAAYVIFTSGSSGTPKGVEVAQRALVNCMCSMAKTPGFSSDDTLVAVTTISFDIAALELYLPLLVGGRVVIASKADVVGGFGLIQLMKSSGATVLQATPSLWRILLEGRFEPPPGMKLLCGGEALPRDLADGLLATGAELWNMYGPTETTIWSSTGRVAKGPAPILVGHPIDNTQLHVLDSRHQLQPLGVPGDLYIGGDGLANGYLNRPDLTEASFRAITLDGRAPQRLYRTGDLARRLADGSLQVLGRVDQQVKLRGFRIEIEEIEAALRTVAGVVSVAVALRPGPAGDPRLVGYYVTDVGVTLSSADLIQHLSRVLPDYMIPTAWRSLRELPLTANGKLDRKSLPDAPSESAAAGREHAPATTPMEITLSAIWSEVLGLQHIGVRDSLFSLGADSLQIFRIAARMADRGIPLQAKHLLQHPTIAEAAGVATQLASAAPNGHAAVPSLRDFRHGARRGSRNA
jgi:amino acid adenylation domain-containing protein